VLTVDKPPNEPGTNTPMFRGNFYAVEGADMPSDKATGFISEFPDEEAGNTNGHHSFQVVFRETVMPGGGAQTGSVRGAVVNGAGRTVVLSGNSVNQSSAVGADGSFSFDNVPAGTYNVAVSGTNVASSVVVTAGQTATITLTVPQNGGNLQQQIAQLQQQVAQLQQQVGQLTSERDKYKNALMQIKQIIQNAGL